jgi:shikimate dehydrogenase
VAAPTPDRYAVIGNPIAHSKSPEIHAAFALQTGQRLSYGRLLGEAGRFTDQVRAFFAAGGRGLNVTVPFKEAAWRLAHERGAAAAAAGAANTLTPLPDGRVRADNTDGVGLVRDLTRNWGLSLQGRAILLVGAGGAARGVVLPLQDTAPAALVVANRTADKAVRLAAELSGPVRVEGCGLDELAGRRFDLVINATAAGLSGQVPPLPEDCLAPEGVAYDMTYADTPTAFVRWGRARGARLAVDGLGMLVEQAAEAFFLWRGVQPDTAPVIEALRSSGRGAGGRGPGRP